MDEERNDRLGTVVRRYFKLGKARNVTSVALGLFPNAYVSFVSTTDQLHAVFQAWEASKRAQAQLGELAYALAAS